MELNTPNKFDELLSKQFIERLDAIKQLPIEQRTYMLTDMLSKEASALQHILDAYSDLTDDILDKLIYTIVTRNASYNDTFSSAFFNVKKGDA